MTLVLKMYSILLIFTLAHLIISTAVLPDVNGYSAHRYEKGRILRRVIRSPQLFSGRNVLSDLSQLKPPTLNDLTEFRQKMTALANLTALLEHAISAEKAARSTLQGFVRNMKEQITGVQKAVNPDTENYWTESKKCGGVLISQTGRISYKTNEFYNNHERCTWTIRANYRSKIKLTFSSGDVEEGDDYISVTEIAENGSEWNTKRITQGETVLFKGPLIFVNFVSDGSVKKKGFLLTFEGMGSNANSRTVYQHFHLTNWTGQLDSTNMSERLEKNGIKIEDGSELFATMLINPANWNASILHISVPESSLDLRPDECNKTSLHFLNTFTGLAHGVSKRCCARTCEVDNFETRNGILLAILRSSDLTEGSHFQIDWRTDTSERKIESVNTCGGILTGNLGRISYKEKTAYVNNERCLWLIKPNILTDGEVKMQLVKDGFEHRYDYVTLSYITSLESDQSETIITKFLYESGPPVKIPSPVVLVEFFSDSATFGKTTGFELIWEIKYTSDQPVGINVEYFSDENGSKQLTCSEENGGESIPNQILLINTHTNRESSPLTLHIEGHVDPEQFAVFGSERGNISKLLGNYESKDGVIVLLIKCCGKLENNQENDLSIKWATPMPSAETTNNDRAMVTSEDECGEILYGDLGRITYKIGKEYDLNERCTWVIRAKTLSTITVQLMADGFESCCDGLYINTIDDLHGVLDPEGIVISRENRFQTLDATMLLVTFTSDHSVRGTGFVLEFQTKGSPVTNSDINLKHLHAYLSAIPLPEEPFGPIFIEPSYNLLSIDTFAFQHVQIASANITATLKMDNLQFNECNQDSVALYDMPSIGKYQRLKKYPSEEMCTVGRLVGENPVSTLLIPDQEEFQPRNGILVVVTKIKSESPDKFLSLVFN